MLDEFLNEQWQNYEEHELDCMTAHFYQMVGYAANNCCMTPFIRNKLRSFLNLPGVNVSEILMLSVKTHGC